ncbi:hypothetical protein MNBD_GAMMA01-309 [hydrothermal vent metagenome]|uniref:Peptidase S8/S53 domain-containing protein n=1 Tax=hydrothermal vent metagenome TaxID=652676 RepID=A0A3B0W7P0_9ZZZZ
MIKRIILLSTIALTLQLQAKISDKFVIAAGQPSVTQVANSLANQLVLSVGVFDPLDERLDFNQSKIQAKESSRYSIVQFNQGKANSGWLTKQGIKVVSYLPNNAFIIVNNKISENILASNKDIRWQGKYLPNYKISPNLWENNLTKQRSYDLTVSIFNDFPKQNLATLFKKYLPDAKFSHYLSGNSHVVKLSINSDINTALSQLASIAAVEFIALFKPLEFLNTEAVSATQANASSGGSATNDDYIPNNTPIWDKGLIGSGQIVAVSDSGLDSNEDWFVHYDNGETITSIVTPAETTHPPAIGTVYPDRKVYGYFTQPGAEPYEESNNGHGTHVTGAVAADRQLSIGSGPEGSISSSTNPGYDNDDGMAPNAQILFQDIGGIVSGGDHDGEPGLTGITTALFAQAYNANARIHSNSWGGEGDGAYVFTDSWVDFNTRTYEDLLILVAAGNDGSLGDNTIGSPGNAKNVVAVGMTGHGNSVQPGAGSSRGPTDDNRIKPDIMAPGTFNESARGNKVNNATITSPARISFTGTSMATPIAAGSAALMRQYYTDGFYPTGVANPADVHTPTGPLMKATLINGAGVDGGHFDKDIGWGRVFLANSISFADSDKQIRVWEVTNKTGLKANQSMEFKLGVKSSEDLAITLVWYDLPAAPGTLKTLINDLDLVVSNGSATYKGNVFGDVATSTTGGTRDDLNTVEQVRLPNPTEGIYTITVSAPLVPGDGSFNSNRQGFALVATGDFDNIDNDPDSLADVTGLTSSSLGETGIQLDWTGGGDADFFEVYRVEGDCETADFKGLRYVGNSETTAFTDATTLNGITYAYKIRAAQYKGLGGLSACTAITSEQACDFPPTFNQNSVSILNNSADICQIQLGWSAGTSNCPTTNEVRYNIYRSEQQGFIPSSDNKIASTAFGATSYIDDRALADTPVYYIVRAEDNSTSNQGPNNGNETSNIGSIRTMAIGIGSTPQQVFEDVDNVSTMTLSPPWSISSARAADGELSYFSNYPNNTCASIKSNTLSITSETANLEYKAFYDLEANWDGVVVEVSTDDGTTWVDFPPIEGYPGDFSETTENPVNACGYPASQKAFSGSSNGQFNSYSHDLTQFEGQDIKVRWRLSTDPGVKMEGFYLDSIQYPNIQVPNVCTVNTAPDKPQPGLYYDPGRSGHGFVIEPIANNDLYYTVFYTYKDDGTPEWYTSLSTLENNVLNINMDEDTLIRFIYDHSVSPIGAGNPNTVDTSIGTNILKIDFNSSTVAGSAACNDGVNRAENVALATWQLGSQTGDWCIAPLIAASDYPTPDFGGTWWTGSDDTGWGLSLSFVDNTEATGDTVVVTIYYFDADGNARWVQGVQGGFQIGQEATLDMREFSGFARDATPVAVTNVSAGTLSLTLNNNNGDENDGILNMNVTYQGTEGGTWSRTNMPVKIFTTPH